MSWFAALCAKPVPNSDHLLVWTAVWILPRRLRWPVGEVSTLWLGLAPDLPNTKHLLRSIRLATDSFCDHIGKTLLYTCWPLGIHHKSSFASKIPGDQFLNVYFTKNFDAKLWSWKMWSLCQWKYFQLKWEYQRFYPKLILALRSALLSKKAMLLNVSTGKTCVCVCVCFTRKLIK